MLLLPGCKKALDYIVHHPGNKVNCRIERITFRDTITFFYDEHGNPVSLRYAEPIDIYSNDKVFKYDEQHRLLLYLNNLAAGGALWWHKYTYVNDHLIIDTTGVYTDGDWSANDSPDYASYYYVTTFELDGLGRVIKETIKYPSNILRVFTYAYDGNGNLIKPGVTYSNKISMWQTNKVWMFLHRDYSVNSPAGLASQYNQYKLPVKLNVMPEFFYGFEFSVPDIVVSYKCK